MHFSRALVNTKEILRRISNAPDPWPQTQAAQPLNDVSLDPQPRNTCVLQQGSDAIVARIFEGNPAGHQESPSNTLWEKSILGIYYVDFAAIGPARGEWRLDRTSSPSKISEVTKLSKQIALELVQKYNQRNAPKRINLFRIIRAEDGAVRYWHNGAHLKLSDYMQNVPLEESAQ